MGKPRRTGRKPPRKPRARSEKPRVRNVVPKSAPAKAKPVAKRKPPPKKRKPPEATVLAETAAPPIAEFADARSDAPDIPPPVASSPNPLDAAADAIIAAFQAHAAARQAQHHPALVEIEACHQPVPPAHDAQPTASLATECAEIEFDCDQTRARPAVDACEVSPTAYEVHDAFDIAVDRDEDPPFDAPDENDQLACDDYWSVDPPPLPPSPPPLNALARAPAPAGLPRAPDREYLTRARNAVQARVEIEKRASMLKRLQRSKIAASIAAGLALPLVLSLAWRFTEPKDAPPLLAPGDAAAAPITNPPASATQLEDEFRAATHLFDAGQTRRGAAALRRLAEDGYAPAQFRLAKMHEHGAGAVRDLSLARQWAERAARAGNIRAMHDVGVYYARGEGAPLDEALAFRWFREAASFGVADSQHNLAILYEQGRGVAANASEALFWYLVAARHGDPNAADRAVALAAHIAPSSVEQARARARAFQAREPNAAANSG